MNGLQISLLTGLGAKAAVEYLTDIGIEGITPRQISYKGKDGYKDILSEDQSATFVAALAQPLDGELHSKVAENYSVLSDWFNAPMGAPYSHPVDSIVIAEDLSGTTEPADGFDLFAEVPHSDHLLDSPENEARLLESVSQVSTGGVRADIELDDLFADDEPDVDDLLDQPSVGAEAVDYDRGPLESDGAGVDAQHTPEATEEGDLFGDLGL